MGIPVSIRLYLAVGTFLLIASLAHADTLYLKNGMYIVVSRAKEKGGEVEYWVGSTKYTISKDLVAKIEPGNGPSSNLHSAAPMQRQVPAVRDLSRREAATTGTGITKHDKLQLPSPSGPKQHEPYWAALRTRIMQGDRVNEMKLAEIELDNEHVRVLRLTLKGDETVPVHDDQDALFVCIKECHIRLTRPGGRPQDIHMQAGESRWIYADTRSEKNLSTQPLEMLVIETK